MHKDNGSSDVHVLYHSIRWHVYWNLFRHGYRKWSVNFRHSKDVGDYTFWVSFGIGNFSVSFRPTRRASDGLKSLAKNQPSTAEVKSPAKKRKVTSRA